jgi:hypothetical protein
MPLSYEAEISNCCASTLLSRNYILTENFIRIELKRFGFAKRDILLKSNSKNIPFSTKIFKILNKFLLSSYCIERTRNIHFVRFRILSKEFFAVLLYWESPSQILQNFCVTGASEQLFAI